MQGGAHKFYAFLRSPDSIFTREFRVRSHFDFVCTKNLADHEFSVARNRAEASGGGGGGQKNPL